MKTLFLGGTCNNSTWREKLIPLLDKTKIDYFDPVVKDWTPECQQKELVARENSDYVLYVITPKMTGVYSIAEAVQDSNIRPEKTIFCVLVEDDGEIFTVPQAKSLGATMKLIKSNGATVLYTLEEIAQFVNSV